MIITFESEFTKEREIIRCLEAWGIVGNKLSHGDIITNHTNSYSESLQKHVVRPTFYDVLFSIANALSIAKFLNGNPCWLSEKFLSEDFFVYVIRANSDKIKVLIRMIDSGRFYPIKINLVRASWSTESNFLHRATNSLNKLT